MKTLPPPAKKREMTACFRLLEKLGTVPLPASEVDTCIDAGIPENQFTRWRDGKRVYLDHIFRLAKKLGRSLDWLADDERPIEEEGPSQKMRDILRAIEELGEDVAYARLINKPERGEPGAAKRQPDKPEPIPSSRKRQPRR